MEKVVILGAGLAGLSCAYHLKEGYEIYEKEGEVGGVCRSKDIDGFTFDYDGHLLHFKNRYALDLLKNLMDGNLAPHHRDSWIFSKGVFTRYPFQANFYGLPEDVIKECISGLARARYSDPLKSHNGDGLTFEDWILRTFGEGIAKYFMIPYNNKFWTVHPSQLTCDWIGRFIPIPTLDEALDGTLNDRESTIGYNSQFWYPIGGGIGEVALAFKRKIKRVNLSKEAVRIDVAKKEVTFSDGGKGKFDRLISTLPLPEIERLIHPLPKSLLSAFRKLKYLSIFNLNLGIGRENISDRHWIYFPEEEFVFFRVGFPSNFSESTYPKGASSIYAEVSYSITRPIDKSSLTQRIVEDLIKGGIICKEDAIRVLDVVDIRYGYIIYDRNYRKSVSAILNFLADNDIFSIGRYGRWRYMSMEDVILDGKQTARMLD